MLDGRKNIAKLLPAWGQMPWALRFAISKPFPPLGGASDTLTALRNHVFFSILTTPWKLLTSWCTLSLVFPLSPAMQPEFRILTHPSACRRECSLFWHSQCSQSDFERGNIFLNKPNSVQFQVIVRIFLFFIIYSDAYSFSLHRSKSNAYAILATILWMIQAGMVSSVLNSVSSFPFTLRACQL